MSIQNSTLYGIAIYDVDVYDAPEAGLDCSASGALSLSASVVVSAQLTATSETQQTVNTALTFAAQIIVFSTGSLTFFGSEINAAQFQVSAQTNFTAQTTVQHNANALFSSTVDWSATANKTAPGSLTLSATGTTTYTSVLSVVFQLTASSNASLTIAGQRTVFGSVSFDSNTNFITITNLIKPGSISYTGNSNFVIETTSDVPDSLDLSGSTSASVTASVVKENSLLASSQSDWSIVIDLSKYAFIHGNAQSDVAIDALREINSELSWTTNTDINFVSHIIFDTALNLLSNSSLSIQGYNIFDISINNSAQTSTEFLGNVDYQSNILLESLSDYYLLLNKIADASVECFANGSAVIDVFVAKDNAFYFEGLSTFIIDSLVQHEALLNISAESNINFNMGIQVLSQITFDASTLLNILGNETFESIIVVSSMSSTSVNGSIVRDAIVFMQSETNWVTLASRLVDATVDISANSFLSSDASITKVNSIDWSAIGLFVSASEVLHNAQWSVVASTVVVIMSEVEHQAVWSVDSNSNMNVEITEFFVGAMTVVANTEINIDTIVDYDSLIDWSSVSVFAIDTESDVPANVNLQTISDLVIDSSIVINSPVVMRADTSASMLATVDKISSVLTCSALATQSVNANLDYSAISQQTGSSNFVTIGNYTVVNKSNMFSDSSFQSSVQGDINGSMSLSGNASALFAAAIQYNSPLILQALSLIDIYANKNYQITLNFNADTLFDNRANIDYTVVFELSSESNKNIFYTVFREIEKSIIADSMIVEERIINILSNGVILSGVNKDVLSDTVIALLQGEITALPVVIADNSVSMFVTTDISGTQTTISDYNTSINIQKDVFARTKSLKDTE